MKGTKKTSVDGKREFDELYDRLDKTQAERGFLQ